MQSDRSPNKTLAMPPCVVLTKRRDSPGALIISETPTLVLRCALLNWFRATLLGLKECPGPLRYWPLLRRSPARRFSPKPKLRYSSQKELDETDVAGNLTKSPVLAQIRQTDRHLSCSYSDAAYSKPRFS